MAYIDKTPAHIKLDEKNHVEEPFLKQLEGMGWTVLRLDLKQLPQDSERENFAEVVMLPKLREALKKINPWLEDDQLEEAIRRITSFPGTDLIENNQYVLKLIQENTTVSENRQTGEHSPTVRYVDFDNRDNNSFVAVCQFKVRVLGTDNHIIPDIVLFLNGLPVAVIECKSPKTKEPIPEAIDQMLRYSEQRGEKGEGSPPLFYYNQMLVATCRQKAKFGTITTHTQKHFYRWADPFPRTLNDLEHGATAPNDQQRLVAGMFDQDNLLSMIRTFTVFGTNEKGETIKIVGRYQQFRAVKLAVKRLLEGTNRRERSGIIWHTQGSGKSLTMMFMVREMYQNPKLMQWKVIFVTDRTQLAGQLSDTGQSIGFTVNKPGSISGLKACLKSDSAELVLAMIQKFQERDLQEVFPILNTSPNVLLMVDEAHRSQYELLGANLDRALPNATRIGYTGTPISKTEKVFGDYIDKYTMRQAIDDGVTLEIVYEGRTHKAEVLDKTGADTMFEDIFSDYNLLERMQILGYGSRDAYLEATETITAKAKDMARHYVTEVFPNGFKAQVVASSQESAVRYKTALDKALLEITAELEQDNPTLISLDRLRELKTDVVISGGHNDLPHIKKYADPKRHEAVIRSFKLPFGAQEDGTSGDIGIVIVMNMLITGFDAPVEQVMYLDRVIVAHNLLQAIARVNRVANDDKEKGFVIDYVGIGHHLRDAIKDYDDREQKEILDCLSSEEQELSDLIASHKAIMDLLARHGLTDLYDHDAFFDLFYDEEIRFEYMLAYRELTRCLNLVFPRKEALDFLHDYQALTEINVLAARHLNDQRFSMKGIPAKLRTVTDAYLISRGIDQKVEPISILDDKFELEVGSHQRSKTKAAEVEHAIRHHIEINILEDPELYASFAEALEKILEDFKNNWDKVYQELEKLRQKIRNLPPPPGGLHRKKHMPFFRILSKEIYGKAYEEGGLTDEELDNLVDLTREIFDAVCLEIRLVGFWQSLPARAKLKADIQGILMSERFHRLPNMTKIHNQIVSRMMELAEANSETILYAV